MIGQNGVVQINVNARVTWGIKGMERIWSRV